MLTQNNIIDLYKKYDVKPSKRFGQNFLIDESVLKNIVNSSNIEGKDVIEIGPGLGSLTHGLLKQVKTLQSYEVDDDMVKVLTSEIDNEKFELIHQDFLKAELNYKGKKTIVANIPYYITSDILFKIFRNSEKIDKAIILVQKEVADNLVSKPGASNYSKLSATADYFCTSVVKLFEVSNKCFMPVPKVTSAIVEITLDNKEIDEDFVKFIKICFAMRRKTLINNLKIFYPKDKLELILNELNLNLLIRPQMLSSAKFGEIYTKLNI